jgi:hypothetical protein
MKPAVIAALAAVLALEVLPSGDARPVSRDSPRSIQQVFRTVAAKPMESVEATKWLLQHAGLDWPMDSPDNPYTHDWVWGVPSRSYNYLVLFGARVGVKTEGFPVGPARYSLLDSSGTALWTRSDVPFLDRPAVSDKGVTALLMEDGPGGPGRMPRLRVEFIARDGRRLGTVAWGDRIWGSCILTCFDTYAFSLDGQAFCIALNQAEGASPDSASRRDYSTIYLLRPDGYVKAAHPVGNYLVRQLLFSRTGHVAYLARRGELHFRGARPLPRIIGVLDEQGALLGQHDLPDADEAVVDPDADLLYSYSPVSGLVALDMRTGGLESKVPIERLESLGRAADSSVSAAAARLLRTIAYFEALPDSLRR